MAQQSIAHPNTWLQCTDRLHKFIIAILVLPIHKPRGIIVCFHKYDQEFPMDSDNSFLFGVVVGLQVVSVVVSK